MACCFGRTFAVVDQFPSKVIRHRLSAALPADFCIKAPRETLIHFDRPESRYADQGTRGDYEQPD